MHRRESYSFALGVLTLFVLAAAPVTSAWGQIPEFGAGFGSRVGGSNGDVQLSAQFTPASEDRPAVLFITAEIPPGFHISSLDQGVTADGFGPQKTEISVSDSADFELLAPFQPIEQPNVHIDEIVWEGLELREHEVRVTWFAPIEIADGVDADSLTISGSVSGQSCSDICIPFETPFAAQVGRGVPLPPDADLSAKAPVVAPLTPEFPEVSPKSPETGETPSWDATVAAASPTQEVSAATYKIDQIELRDGGDRPLGYYLLLAFLGGIILNVMPCVLPVIGLKVMSFVHQAGESRARAWSLNLWYSLGIIAVFLVLAGLAVSVQASWGILATLGFSITLLAVVFAMALSLLGLWEIPIPGFFGSGAAVDMAEREGVFGAFLKGALTTVLATPCTGPLMATALAWAVKQPAGTTFSVFGMLGLGMASPYLLIGAFPSLIRFLPKPGPWMETFKKLMGFVLLTTVVWLLSFLDPPLVVPTVALMVGIAAACWWVAQTPITAPFGDKAYAWATAGIFTAIVAIGSYGWLYKQVMLERFEIAVNRTAEQVASEQQIAIAQELSKVNSPQQLAAYQQELVARSAASGGQWQPFTLDRLARIAVEEQRTVLVDFTADWCFNCKVFEATVLKTDDIESAIEEAEVVTMVADYTKKPEWMTQTIRALGGEGVPLIAIFPADDPYRPIVFNGAYTKGNILEAIAEATGENVTETAAAASQTKR